MLSWSTQGGEASSSTRCKQLLPVSCVSQQLACASQYSDPDHTVAIKVARQPRPKQQHGQLQEKVAGLADLQMSMPTVAASSFTCCDPCSHMSAQANS